MCLQCEVKKKSIASSVLAVGLQVLLCLQVILSVFRGFKCSSASKRESPECLATSAVSLVADIVSLPVASARSASAGQGEGVSGARVGNPSHVGHNRHRREERRRQTSAHPSWDLGACLIALSVCYVIVPQCRGCTLSASMCVSPAG